MDYYFLLIYIYITILYQIHKLNCQYVFLVEELFMELTIDAALQKAIEAHKAEQLEDADRLYTAILKVQPQHPDANHNLGVLAVSIGKVQEALPLFETALKANPNISQFWLSYIEALIKLNQIDEAQTVFNEADTRFTASKNFDSLDKKIKASLNKLPHTKIRP